jgi:hypothetical protein
VDILGIETRLPDPEKIKSVQFGGQQYTAREDIDNFLRLQADALEYRAEEPGIYVLVDGEWIGCFGENYDLFDEESPNNRYTHVDSKNLTYEMENGKLIRRHYNIWLENEFRQSEAGRISESYLTRWDTINSRTITVDGAERNRLDLILENVKGIYVDYMEETVRNQDLEALQKELARDAHSLIAAIRADCAEGNMAQNYYYHTGSFRMEDAYTDTGYRYQGELGISISGEKCSWWISVYPDSVHTLGWLKAHGVLPAEISELRLR